jgi:hypothetical protein
MEAISANEIIVAQRSNSLAVLIAETKKKNALEEQHFAYQFLGSNPIQWRLKNFLRQ